MSKKTKKKYTGKYIKLYQRDMETMKKLGFHSDVVLPLSLIRSYDNKGKKCFLSQQYMANKFHVCLKTINSHIAKLKKADLIEAKFRSQPSKKIYSTSEYTSNNLKTVQKGKAYLVPEEVFNLGLNPFQLLIVTLIINRETRMNIIRLVSKTTYYRTLKAISKNKKVMEFIMIYKKKLTRTVKRYIMKLIKNTIEAEESNRTVKCGNYNGSIEFLQDCYV